MAELSDKPGYSFDRGAPPEVSRYFKNKELKPSFSWNDVEPEEHAVAFTVAKAMQVDVLSTIQDALKEALDKGVPYDQFAKELEPRLRKLGWWGIKEQIDPVTGNVQKVRLGSPRRLKTIYRANMRSARAAGQWDRIERSKRAMPYLVYLLGPSEKHRPHHEAKAGLVLPVDDPFWRSWFPPNGWNCKCHVRQITRREAERRGVSESPRLPTKEVVNPRTGEVKRIPAGIDRGWESNPGLHRVRHMEDFIAGKLNEVDPMIARAAARDMSTSWRMHRILDGSAKGRVPVAILPEDLKSVLGAKTTVVEYSDEAAAIARANHPDLKLEDFARVDDVLQRGTLYGGGDQTLIFAREQAGQTWVATVRTRAGGDELELAAFHKASAEFAETFLRPENRTGPR